MPNQNPFSPLPFATLLQEARLAAHEVRRLTEREPGLTLEQAYRIQAEGIALRQKQGERVVGYKMGLTSEAKRKQMGLKKAIFGVLTDRMALTEDHPYLLSTQIHPKAEPEIAFRLASPLSGALTAEQAWERVDQVAPAIEVLDSRYVGFKYFSLPDVVADNASSSQFLIGRPVMRPSHWRSLEEWKLTFSVNAHPIHAAAGREISGSPIQSLMDLGRLLEEQGLTAPAGSWVLLGAATPAVALTSGDQVLLELEAPSCSIGQVRLGVL